VIICKGCHEVVAVVVVWLHAEVDSFVVSGLLGSLDQVLGQELLLFVKVISGALHNVNILKRYSQLGDTDNVDEHLQWAFPLLHKLRSIILLPLFLILSEVSLECLFAPGAVDRVSDGCECGDGLVFAGVLQELILRKSAA
jgi:hypothetical protein